MGNPAYATGSFEDFVTKETNYANWFLVSSTGPIIDNYLGNGGIVLGGITRAQRASEAYLGSHIEALQAQVRDFEGAAIAREGYMQEEIARALAQKRELQQKK